MAIDRDQDSERAARIDALVGEARANAKVNATRPATPIPLPRQLTPSKRMMGQQTVSVLRVSIALLLQDTANIKKRLDQMLAEVTQTEPTGNHVAKVKRLVGATRATRAQVKPTLNRTQRHRRATNH